MMAGQSKRNLEDAKRVEIALRSEGRHMEAQAIARLISSQASAVGTLKTLHADNLELRRKIEKMGVWA